MAKRRTKKAKTNQISFSTTIIILGTLFSAVLFIIKIINGSVSWFEIFAPVLIAFFIIFLLSALKSVLRKV